MLRVFVVLLGVMVGAFAVAQTSMWQSWPLPLSRPIYPTFRVNEFASFRANPFLLRSALQSAPMEDRGDPGVIIEMPAPDGTLQRFRLWESPIQTPEVAAQTGVRTYRAQGIDDPWATGRFDIGRNGFHGMVLSPMGDYFIEPVSQGNVYDHIAFFQRDCSRLLCFECTAPTGGTLVDAIGSGKSGGGPDRPGPNRKEYRLALKGTGEYTAFYGGQANADAGSVTVMNRVNGVYERDIAIRMIIVNLVNYTDPNTDPYSNGNGGAMLSQNQTTCDANPGNANYDIGHVFSTGGGGVAGLRVVGVTGQKARGVTGLPSPIGDPFAIDYVAHEMGHQYGANHTFNSISGSCNGNRSASHAYEVGSGSTIMAYAGICSPENVQSNSDDYMHLDSLSAIEAWRNNAGSGGSTIATGNNSPTVNAGPDYTIPQDTPFRLTATASDADGDALTYCWEEWDLGSATPNPDESTKPLFRSQKPMTSPTRWFPKQATVIVNGTDQWENPPSVNRTMRFRCTVRDNRSGGGNYEWDETVLTISGSPFAVTAPNTAVNWAGGSTQTVMWNVGGGSVAANVRILLSTDGGNSYFNGSANTILASTPNDGSQTITVPNIGTSQARIVVEAVGNAFFDMSNVNFTITPSTVRFVPSSYSVVEGSDMGPGLSALLLSDDTRLAVGANMPNQATTTLQVAATAPAMAFARLSFILEHQSNDGARSRQIQLYNFQTQQWESVSTTTGTLADSTVQVDITSNASRFIDGTTREVRARAHLWSSTISRTGQRIVDRFDFTAWELAP